MLANITLSCLQRPSICHDGDWYYIYYKKTNQKNPNIFSFTFIFVLHRHWNNLHYNNYVIGNQCLFSEVKNKTLSGPQKIQITSPDVHRGHAPLLYAQVTSTYPYMHRLQVPSPLHIDAYNCLMSIDDLYLSSCTHTAHTCSCVH